MPGYRLDEIGRITGGELLGEGNRRISLLLTDTRQLIPRAESLFIAIRGPNHDGHDFLEDAYKKGARDFMINEQHPVPAWPGASWLIVENTLYALQALAAFHRGGFKNPVLAISGSNGKTILKEWLYQMLHVKINLLRSPRSYNSQLGVPLSVWLLEPEHEMAIFEAGISKPGEMQHLAEIIRPDMGILTNILDAHQENFGSYEEKAVEKIKLFRDSKVFYYCADQKIISDLLAVDPGLVKGRKVCWSETGPADLQVRSVRRSRNNTLLEAGFRGQKVELQIPFTDRASVENVLHAWLFLLDRGEDPEWIAGRAASLTPVAMRLEQKKGINRCTLINDSYNSDLVSLRIGLEYLSLQKQNGGKTLILTDIQQSGLPDNVLYQAVAALTGQHGIDEFIGIGPALKNHAGLFPPGSRFYSSTEEFGQQLQGFRFHDRAILLKGSRQYGLEKISSMLEEKVHQTVLEIDLAAMVNNLNYYRSLLPAGTRIMVMVKAFSYGAGTHEIAGMLQYHRVDYLAVAYTDEGISLREAGISLPIMIMNPEEQGFDALIRYRLEPEIYSTGLLEKFIHAVEKQGEHDFPVHLKLDTGMHRLGFLPEEIPALCSRLREQKSLRIASVFSHLASSDDPAEDSFTRKQIDLFRQLSSSLTEKLGYPVWRHILNSGGIERFPDASFEMVRLGIGLYGISPSGHSSLMHVGTLKSSISQVKRIAGGETVGYNRRGKVAEEMQVAVVPMGYADGLNRKLGNGRGKMLVKGKLVPLVGDVCMDMCMIDVTGLDAKEGDEVVVFGRDLPVTLLAEWLETIPYEILTSVSSRVKRIYFQE